MQETFYTTSTGLTTLTSSYQTIRTLSFRPTTQTKFLVLAQSMAAITYSTTTDACQTVLGPCAVYLNGTTIAETDIGNMHTYYCLDAVVGTTYTLELKAKRLHSNGTDKAYGARLAAIGIDDWYRIEQGVVQTLAGTTTNTETVLMQEIIEPMFGNCLVFSYAEYKPDSNINLRTAFSLEIDNSQLRTQKLLDLNLQEVSGFQEDFTAITSTPRWSSISSMNVLDLEGSRTTIAFKAAKLDSVSDSAYFRKLRTVLIPITKNQFGPVHYQYSKGGTEFTGTQTEFASMVPHPRTVTDFDYLVLASCRTHLTSGDGPAQTVFRYDGLGMAGTTANLVGISGFYATDAKTAMQASGVTFGISNDDILAVKTYNLAQATPTNTGYNGSQHFGFNVVGATQIRKDSFYFFHGAQYQQNEEVISKTADRLMAVILLPT